MSFFGLFGDDEESKTTGIAPTEPGATAGDEAARCAAEGALWGTMALPLIGTAAGAVAGGAYGMFDHWLHADEQPVMSAQSGAAGAVAAGAQAAGGKAIYQANAEASSDKARQQWQEQEYKKRMAAAGPHDAVNYPASWEYTGG